MRSIYFIIASAFLLGACEEVVKLDHLRPEPKIVINSLPEAGQPVSAILSRSWFYTDPKPDVQAMEFEVNLYVNGAWQETLQVDSALNLLLKKRYNGRYVPKVGDELRLTATSPGFKMAEGCTRIPQLPDLLGFEKTVKEGNATTGPDLGYDRPNIEYTVKIRDKKESDNFYMIRIEDRAEGHEADDYWTPVTLDFFAEPVFNAQLSAFDKIMGYDYLEGIERAFTDELFRDAEYTLRLKVYYGINGEESKALLWHLSPEYYRYWYTLQMREGNVNSDLANAGMGEPMRVYSNIKGGLGIVAGRCSTELRIKTGE